MGCSLLYPSHSIFDTNPYSLHYLPARDNICSYLIKHYPSYDSLCLDFRNHLVPEPPTPSFSEPSIASALTTSNTTSCKRKRTTQSEGEGQSLAVQRLLDCDELMMPPHRV